MRKRTLAWILSLSLLFSSIAAIPFATAEELSELTKIYPEFATPHTLTITWFEQGWTGPEASLDIVAPEIERRTNLKLIYEPMTVPTENDYTQKLNLMVAANEVPEVFFGGISPYTRLIYEKLGQAGSLWSFEELVAQYDRLNNLIYPEMNLYRTGDGKNYFIPTQTGSGYHEFLDEPPHGLYIRKDFLEQLGMDYPSTPDAFYDYLKRATTELTVNGQPVNGLLMGENLGGIEQLYEMYFPLVGRRETVDIPFDSQNNFTAVNYGFSNSPQFIEGAKYINKLAREGLIDREALIIKTPQFHERGSSGTYAAIFASWWEINTFTDNAKAAVPDIYWVCPPPIYASEEVRASRNLPWTDAVGAWSSLIVSKSVDEQTLRHLLAVMDYLTTTEGQLLVQAGINGVSYAFNDEGKYVFTEEFIKETNELDWNKAAAYGVFYYAQLVQDSSALLEVRTTPASLQRADNMLSWENQAGTRKSYDKDMDPPLDYYFLPGEVQNEKFQPIKDQRKEYLARVLTAADDAETEAIMNEWDETCRSMGIDEIIAERQAIMNEIIANAKK